MVVVDGHRSHGDYCFPAEVGQNWDSYGPADPVENLVESLGSCRLQRVKNLNPGRRQVIHRIQPFRTRG